MKKLNKKTALILSAVLIPVAATAAVAIPKLTHRRRQDGWRRVDY